MLLKWHHGPELAIVVLLWARVTSAQVPVRAQNTELQRVLAKLGEDAVALERTLPSFTCEEDVVSQEMRGDKVKRVTTATMTLRAVKGQDGDLKESFSYTSVNGKPFTEGVVRMPVFVSGGFNEALRYFHPDMRKCYEFDLSPGQINFKSSEEGIRYGCNERGLTGFARLDAAGDVSYVERTVPIETARPSHLATYASATLITVGMGNKTYRLSSHMVAEMPMGRSLGRFEATYSACRLFKATATIGPAEIMPDDVAAPKP